MPAYKDNKGRWYCKFYADTWGGNKRQILKRGFTTKKEALAYEYEYKASTSHSPDISLKTLYKNFIDDYKTNTRPNSYKVTVCIIERHILPFFGNTPINEISPIMCRKWQNQIKEKNYSLNTQKNIEVCFRKLLNFAVKYYDLPKNPFAPVKSIGKITHRSDVITLDDFKNMAKHFTDITDRAMFNLLFYSGLRLSEMRGLTFEDIDFQKCIIHVNKQMQFNNPAQLKTSYSKRSITLPKFVIDDIETFFNSFEELPKFPFAYISGKAVRSRLIHLCDCIGISHITPHTLRHSHATLLITHNIPVNIISKRLGHANITTTLNIYSHCFKDSDSDVAVFLDKVSK